MLADTIDPARWQHLERLFTEALGLPAAERDAYLAAACGDDHALLAEVQSLLGNAAQTGRRLRSAIAAGADALVRRDDDYLGQRIGPYRVLSLLGSGGMGTVYLAERDDGQYRHQVALKLLHHAQASHQVVARFRDERQILATLDHPAIVRLLDGGTTDDGLPYLVMEYIAGQPLDSYARDLPIRERVALMLAICEPLQHAHQRLVVHRDIKPSNVLVDAHGRPKLLDFGIAKLLEPSAGPGREARTRTGVALLTPEYASPEQARGDAITVATDVYSLGALLFHLITGRPPQVPSDDVLATLRTICEVDPPRPSTLVPPERAALRGAIGDLDNITLRALQKSPAARYPSVAALADDLQRYLDGRPVVAREATFGYRAGKFIRRHRGVIALGAFVFIALTVATIVSIMQADRASEAADDALRQNRTLLVEQGRQALADGHAGRALPYLVAAWERGEDTAAVRFLVAEAMRPFEREVATVRDFPQGVLHTAWAPAQRKAKLDRAPDGASFVVCGDGGRIATYSSDGVLRHRLDIDTPTSLGGCMFDPTGSRVVALGYDGSLRLWDTTTGALLHTTPDTTSPTDQPTVWTGRVIDVAYGDHGRRIVGCRHDLPTLVWDAATGAELLRVPTDGVGPNVCALSNDGARLFTSGYFRVLEYDARTGVLVRDLTHLTDPSGADRSGTFVGVLRLSPDGSRLYFSGGRSAVIWDVVNAREVARLPGHAQGINYISLSPDGQRVMTSDGAGAAKLWDARSGAPLFDLHGHGRNAVGHSDFDPSGAHVLTTAGDNVYRIFSTATGQLETSLETTVTTGTAPRSPAIATSGQYSPDGARVLSHIGAEVLVWRAGPDAMLADITTTGAVLAGALSPDERRLLAAGPGAMAEVRSLPDGALLAKLDATGGFLWDAAWSPHDVLAVGGDKGYLALFSPSGGPPTRRLEGHTGTVNGVRFSPDGAVLATAGDEGVARLWDVATGTIHTELPHGARVTSVQWSRDGKRLATSAWDGTLRVWNVASGRVEASIDAAPGLLTVAFTPDETGLTGGTRGGTAAIWDIASGQRRLTLEGHTGPVTSIVYSPDARLLATTCVDLHVRLWDPDTGLELGRRSHSVEILQGVWLADSARLVTFGNGPFVRLWDARRALGTAQDAATFLATRVPWRLTDNRIERVMPPRTH